MKNLIALIEEIKSRKLRISDTQRGEQIQQTDRNTLKKDILNAISADIAENYDFVFRSEDGILVEIANDCVADNIKNEDGSGAITIAIDLKVMGLEHNAEVESESYNEILRAKEEKKKQDKEKKMQKIARDKKTREEKKGK